MPISDHTKSNWSRPFLMVTGFHLLLLTATSLAARVTLNSAGHFVDPDGRVRIFHGEHPAPSVQPCSHCCRHHCSIVVRGECSAKELALAPFDRYVRCPVVTQCPRYGQSQGLGFQHSASRCDVVCRANTLHCDRHRVRRPGVEPSPGQYNTTYLQVMRQLVDDLHKGVDSHCCQSLTLLSHDWCSWLIYNCGLPSGRHRTEMVSIRGLPAVDWLFRCGEGIPNWLQAQLMPVETKCSSMTGIVRVPPPSEAKCSSMTCNSPSVKPQ